MQFGPGSAWVDDVSFDITGEIRRDPAEPARPLTAQGLVNLTAFTRLYGYVRHFHPSDQAARTDWETFAVEGVRKVESAATTVELIDRLRAAFQPIAPGAAIYATAAPPPPVPVPDAKSYLRYQHNGVGLDNGMIYRSPRNAVSPPLPKPFEAELVPGVTARVPLVVPVEDGHTLPLAPAAEPLPIYSRTAADRATRLADVVIAWNIMQHFYPYFDVVKTDWLAELPKALRSAATDPDSAAFLATLQRLVAALHDGHGNVMGGAMSFRVPPIAMAWVDGQLLVTQVFKSCPPGIVPGDRVVRIDGKPIDQATADARARISAATEGWMRARLRSELSLCKSSSMQLEFEPYDGGSNKLFDLPCAQPKSKDPEAYPEPRPVEKVTELEPGIFYVDLDRVTDKEWTDAIPRLEKAKGIVFDMRGYPGGPGIQSLAHLTDSPIRSAKWNIPSPLQPDRLEVKWNESGWPVPPQKPYFAAKRAFLIDGRAISYAETVMGIVEAFKLGEIVGEPTAGTNGNVNPFKLAGGYTISWTGMKVLKHDGSQHHGIGILPTVPVSRTRKGVAEGKDELLLKAVEVLKR